MTTGGETTVRVRSPIVAAVLAAAFIVAGFSVEGGGRTEASTAPSDSCSDVPQFLGDAAHTGAVAGPPPTGELSLLWNYPTLSPINSSPAIVDGVAYIVDGLLGEGGLRAIDLATGDEVWNVAVAGQPSSSTPAVINGAAYVGDLAGNLTAIDIASRTVAWTVSLGEEVTSSPAVSGDTIFVNVDDVLYAVDPADGSTRWSFANGGDGGYTIESSPAVADGVVYTTSPSFEHAETALWALDAATGAELWSYDPPEPGLDSPVVVDGVVYAGGSAGLVAVDAASGDEVWTSEIGQFFSAAPAVADGIVYAHTSRQLVAVDAATGEVLWAADDTGGGASTPAVAGGAVFVGGSGLAFQLSIHLYDAASGEHLGRLADLGSVHAAPVVADGVIYAGTSSAGLVAIGDPDQLRCTAP